MQKKTVTTYREAQAFVNLEWSKFVGDILEPQGILDILVHDYELKKPKMYLFQKEFGSTESRYKAGQDLRQAYEWLSVDPELRNITKEMYLCRKINPRKIDEGIM